MRREREIFYELESTDDDDVDSDSYSGSDDEDPDEDRRAKRRRRRARFGFEALEGIRSGGNLAGAPTDADGNVFMSSMFDLLSRIADSRMEEFDKNMETELERRKSVDVSTMSVADAFMHMTTARCRKNLSFSALRAIEEDRKAGVIKFLIEELGVGEVDYQGIAWEGLRLSRREWRMQRLIEYNNYRNTMLPATDRACLVRPEYTRSVFKLVNFTKTFEPDIPHFQLRNLCAATSKHDLLFVGHNARMLHLDAITGKTRYDMK